MTLVVIPCLNEEAHLGALLTQLGRDGAVTRIVVADGGSADRSTGIVRAAAEADARIVLMHNSKRIQAAGVNLVIAAHGDASSFFVRVDAHAAYPENYVSQLLAAQVESGAESVTVSMRAVAPAGACFQRATAVAQNSALGTGGSAHRAGGARRWVDHGHHALMSVAAFRAAGGYDERFSHNEDAELDRRLTDKGGKILLAADILIDYAPRATAQGLARQYFNFGAGRAMTVRKHKTPLKPRQFAPIAVAPALLLALLAPIWPIAALPAALWLALCVGYGIVLGARARSLCACASGVAAAIMHAAWSAGFISRWFAPTRASAHSPASA